MTTAVRHVYKPRGAALDLFDEQSDEVLLSGPAGTGKSRACLEKLLIMALLNPDMRGLIARKTLVSLGSTALVTWRKHVAREGIDAGDLWFYGGGPQEPAGYKFTNGSFVAIGGLDKPSKIMSSEYDVIYVQEATELEIDDWEALTTRLRNGQVSFQQIIADCNPGAPSHWLNKRSESGKTRMMLSQHEDNPVLFDEFGRITPGGAAYIAKLDALTGVRYLRLRKGLWAAAEGLVYENYNPAIHLVDWFEPPQDWSRWWAVDFGFKNPFVCQWWAEDHDGGLWLYREIYKTGGLVEDHARHMLRLVTDDSGQWTEPRPRAIICDHDAEDRATLERHLGMSTIAADKRVQMGVQLVESRLKINPGHRTGLHFMRDCTVERDQDLEDRKLPASTVEEITEYVWDTANGKPPKEVPKKENDHGMDAKRYLVAARDAGPTSFKVRFLGARR